MLLRKESIASRNSSRSFASSNDSLSAKFPDSCWSQPSQSSLSSIYGDCGSIDILSMSEGKPSLLRHNTTDWTMTADAMAHDMTANYLKVLGHLRDTENSAGYCVANSDLDQTMSAALCSSPNFKSTITHFDIHPSIQAVPWPSFETPNRFMNAAYEMGEDELPCLSSNASTPTNRRRFLSDDDSSSTLFLSSPVTPISMSPTDHFPDIAHLQTSMAVSSNLNLSMDLDLDLDETAFFPMVRDEDSQYMESLHSSFSTVPASPSPPAKNVVKREVVEVSPMSMPSRNVNLKRKRTADVEYYREPSTTLRKRIKRKTIRELVPVEPRAPERNSCPVCPSRGFKRDEHFKRHLRTHLEERKYVCELCPRMFNVNRMDNIITHVKHHAEPDSRGKKIKYFPRAVAILDKLRQKRPRTRKESVESLIAQVIESCMPGIDSNLEL